MKRMHRGMLTAALVGAMAGGAAPVVTGGVGLTTTDTGSNVSAKSTTGTKATVNKNGSKANRLTSSRRAGRYWLIPNNKESFKQGRRKQLAKRSFKKAKKQGRA